MVRVALGGPAQLTRVSANRFVSQMNFRHLLSTWGSGPRHPDRSALVAYVTGDLDARRRGEVFVHLAECVPCSEEVWQIGNIFNRIDSETDQAFAAHVDDGTVAEGRERLLTAMRSFAAAPGCDLIR